MGQKRTFCLIKSQFPGIGSKAPFGVCKTNPTVYLLIWLFVKWSREKQRTHAPFQVTVLQIIQENIVRDCVRVCACGWICVCMCVCRCMCMFACVSVYVCVWACACVGRGCTKVSCSESPHVLSQSLSLASHLPLQYFRLSHELNCVENSKWSTVLAGAAQEAKWTWSKSTCHRPRPGAGKHWRIQRALGARAPLAPKIFF